VGAKTSAKIRTPIQQQAADRAAILFKHVSDQTRVRIILMLSEGEKHVGAMSTEFAQSQPALSHHLVILQYGGIVAARRQGRKSFYRLMETGERLVKLVEGIMEMNKVVKR
jgi:DNA-binding transcriptional ArsR family regulator